MAQNLIKINYEGEKCAGLYLVDEDFGGKEITKGAAPQGRGTFKIVLRQTVQILGKGKVTSKETFVKQGTTFLKAIQAVIAERELMKQRMVDKVTGASVKHEEAAKIDFITVDQLWQQYYIHRTTSATQGKRQKKWVVKYSVNGKPIGGTGYIMESSYNGLVKPTLGNVPVMQIKKKHVEDLINKLVKGGYSARYVKGVVDILRPMIEWFFDREEIDKRNPAGNVSLHFDNKRNVIIEFKDVQKLYKAMLTYKDNKYRCVFLWLATGRRVGEVLSQHTDNIKGDYFTVTAANNKAGVDMIYKMSDAMKATAPTIGYIHTSVKDPQVQLAKSSVDRHWKKIKKECALEELHMHDIRHLITTILEDSEVPLELRSKVLGHKINAMASRYRADTEPQADTKLEVVSFFMKKIAGEIPESMKWSEYNAL